MNTPLLASLLAAAPVVLGTAAGLIQRNTTGKPQRIAAAGAALLIDLLKFIDAVRGSTNPDAVMLTAGSVILTPAAASKTVGFIGKAGEPLAAGQLVSIAMPGSVPAAPDSSKLPGVLADAPTTKPDLTQS